MEKVTRTQFLNKNISQTCCIHKEINSRHPTSFNRHFSQTCISPSPQSTSGIAREKTPESQFPFQKFSVSLYSCIALFSFSNYLKQNLKTCLQHFLSGWIQRQQSANYCSSSLWWIESLVLSQTSEPVVVLPAISTAAGITRNALYSSVLMSLKKKTKWKCVFNAYFAKNTVQRSLKSWQSIVVVRHSPPLLFLSSWCSLAGLSRAKLLLTLDNLQSWE